MNYKDIEVFLELVRCRNITKAAENLYLSQSAVSNRLKSLEDEMGVQLFLRAKGHRIVELTRQGGEFIPVAERWKALYEETELIRSSALSVVRIATNESTFDRIVTPMLQGYIRRNPDKKVCVKICDSREAYDLVSKDLVDFGFAAYSSNLGGVVARCIDSQPLCLVRAIGAGDPSVPVHPGELDPEMEVQSVGGDFNGITRWREKWFGTSHRAHIEVNTASGVITFLNDPTYWVLLPQASAELLVQRAPLQIYELTDPPELWNIYLLRSQRSQTRSTAVCRAFEQELTDFLAGRAQP